MNWILDGIALVLLIEGIRRKNPLLLVVCMAVTAFVIAN